MKDNKKLDFSNILNLLVSGEKFVHKIYKELMDKKNFLTSMGFSLKNPEISNKLSFFRSAKIAADTKVKNNRIIACQFNKADIADKSHVKNNEFKAVYLTNFSMIRADLCDTNINLSSINSVKLKETCFHQDKISFSIWDNIDLLESDFIDNAINRCKFTDVKILSSRLAKLNFINVNMQKCQFNSCDIQGFEFEDCEFIECTFNKIAITSPVNIKVTGCRVYGQNFSECTSAESFIQMLKN